MGTWAPTNKIIGDIPNFTVQNVTIFQPQHNTAFPEFNGNHWSFEMDKVPGHYLKKFVAIQLFFLVSRYDFIWGLVGTISAPKLPTSYRKWQKVVVIDRDVKNVVLCPCPTLFATLQGLTYSFCYLPGLQNNWHFSIRLFRIWKMLNSFICPWPSGTGLCEALATWKEVKKWSYFQSYQPNFGQLVAQKWQKIAKTSYF